MVGQVDRLKGSFGRGGLRGVRRGDEDRGEGNGGQLVVAESSPEVLEEGGGEDLVAKEGVGGVHQAVVRKLGLYVKDAKGLGGGWAAAGGNNAWEPWGESDGGEGREKPTEVDDGGAGGVPLGIPCPAEGAGKYGVKVLGAVIGDEGVVGGSCGTGNAANAVAEVGVPAGGAEGLEAGEAREDTREVGTEGVMANRAAF